MDPYFYPACNSIPHNHPVEKGITVAMLDAWRVTCPRCKAEHEEHEELMRLAIPIYQDAARRGGNPWYVARLDDDNFWHKYIGSRIVEARTLVAQAKEPPKE